jgi:hypothetical protein
MATEKKSWNDMSAKEQEARRKKERRERNFISAYAKDNSILSGTYLKELTKDMSPQEARDETSRLTALAIAKKSEDARNYKQKYNRLWSESSVGTESNINRRNLSRDIGAASREIENLKSERQRGGRWENKRGGRLGTTQEINAFNSEMDRKIKEAQRRERDLKDSLSIFDSQYREAGKSWISQKQAEDARLEEAESNRFDQEQIEFKYGKGFRGDPGGYTGAQKNLINQQKIQMQRPPQQKQGQPKGMPQQIAQSPAMAQARKTFVPYSARTGRELKGAELDNLYKGELASWQQGTSRPSSFNRNRNPYYDSFKNNKYYQRKRATEYSMANFRNPNAMSDFYKNQY